MHFPTLKIPSALNTSDNNLSDDFFIPLLRHARTYNRGVGFFSSGWLKLNSIGLVDFAQNGGRAKWITSPILSEEDWEALKLGDEARQDELLRSKLRSQIYDVQTSLERNTTNALAWMVADGVLEFKLALLHGKLSGEFHDKFGVFVDEPGNTISFNGSNNESIQGSHNYEAFKVFKSWMPEQIDWVNSDVRRFERLWNNQDPNVRVLDIGQSNKENIIKLRSGERPYFSPNSQEPPSVDYKAPGRPAIQLRDYQEEAIKSWFDNDCKGFFEMATGTGKTITSLAAARKLFIREGRLALIIAVPYQHLVDQWEDDAKQFKFNPVLAYKSKQQWLNTLNRQVVEYNNNIRAEVCIITTHDTFSNSDFQASIARLDSPALIIADEAHHLGTETAQKAYPQNFSFRLALSATPNRWYDDEGTTALREFFGETVYEFPLACAIGVSLTPYYYYPVLVQLNPEELESYQEFSLKIARLYGRIKSDIEEERLKKLFLKRADILNGAANKITVLSKLLDTQGNVRKTLLFCAPGQIDEVVRMVGVEKDILVHTFTSRENNDVRKNLLADFASDRLQALAAIKCLDEGVDVPSTETAYLLASTSNPREFIQRRGRILRKAEGKEFSYLYDLITVPPENFFSDKTSAMYKAERNILSKEFARFREFAESAENKHQAIDTIWEIAKRYDLMGF